MGSQASICFFDGFEFDSERLALYFDGELVAVEKRALQVLAVLVRSPRKLTATQEIIDEVWADNTIGVNQGHVAQTISKLRKAFSDIDTERNYIRTVKGSGYVFEADVEFEEVGSASVPEPVGLVEALAAQTDSKARPRRWAPLLAGGAVLVLLSIVAWRWLPADHEADVRRVVKESQLFESLVLYKNPAVFDEASLDKYWTAELDISSNFDRGKIRNLVQKLISEGRRYGDETKCEQFDFQSIEIDVDGETALVRTLEKWFIAEYRTEDGSLIKTKTVGPYFVNYIVKNVDGRWRIEKSNTARTNLPAPGLTRIEPRGDLAAGKQSFVNLIGEDFLHEVVFLKVVGDGCPEFDPCIVPNSAMREHAKFTPTLIENVPLTLKSGRYSLLAQNGNSNPSAPVALTIP